MTRSTVRPRAWAGAIVAAALLVAACGDDDGEDAVSTSTSAAQTGDDDSGGAGPAPQPLAERTTVTAATPFLAIEAYVPFLLADHYGEFEKENLELKVETVQHPDALVLMQNGSIDFGPISLFAGLFNAIEAGSDLRIVAAGPGFSPDTQAGFWARSEYFDDGEADPCDFDGTTWAFGAVQLGSVNGLVADEFLAECDLSITDITVSPLQGADALVALQNGSIDVAVLPDPVWQTADADGSAELLVPFGTFPGAALVMGPFRHEEPEAAAAVMRALVRTTQTYLQGDYRSDPDVRAALVEVMDVPPETLDVGEPLVFYPDMNFTESVFEPLQEMWLRAGGIVGYDEPLTDEDLLDLSLLEAATADG